MPIARQDILLSLIFTFHSDIFLFQIQATIGELIQLSENEDAHKTSDNRFKETAFIEGPMLTASEKPSKKLTRQAFSDPKLEKKVTFARLLNKMSAEINVGSDIDVSLLDYINLKKEF